MSSLKFKVLGILFSAAMALITTAHAADVIQKNPRVAELEDKLTGDATSYLKGRFPNRPFMVVVSIDPLRRSSAGMQNTQKTGDQSLPYLDVQGTEEIQDEWDDPQISLNELMQRVQKAIVTLSLPSTVSDDEVREIKAALFSYLHLIPARDEVQVDRRSWATDNTTWLYIGMSFALAGMLLIGFFFINRSSSMRIGAALAESRQGGGGQGFSSSAASASVPPAQFEKADGPSGDVHVSDPIRLRELATRLIDDILKDGSFPNHHDMFVLDQFGSENPRGLGGILKLFPLSMQKTLFSYSFHPCWMEAFHRPGSLTIDSIEELQRISQNPRDPKSNDWEKLLLAVWRLDDQLANFVKTMKQDEAFSILTELPKAISLGVARKAFPGNWGVLLDPGFVGRKPGPAEISATTEAALRLKPLHDFNLLQKYKSEVELLEYLKHADIAAERDIYGASPEDSMIHKLRKPFYPVLDQAEDLLKELVPMLSLDQWAMAIFNVSKAERRAIESTLNEKQRYLFGEKMKHFDTNPPDKRVVSEIRGRISDMMAAAQVARAQAKINEANAKTERGEADEESPADDRQAA